MKKIVWALLFLNCCISCKKSGTSNGTVDNDQPKIYFQGSSPTGVWSEIYSVNIDGTGQQQLTNFSHNGLTNEFTSEPALSADGKKIFFISDKDFSGGELFSMNLDGSGVTKVISKIVNQSQFRDHLIYQNGQKITYCLEMGVGPTQHGEIFTADINGSNAVSLTNYPADGNCYHPCVDPANTTIVYSNLITGAGIQLYAMNLNGANKRPLTSGAPTVKFRPQFSPDGTKIVFDAPLGAPFEIFIMDANGTNMKQLTNYSNNGTNLFKSSWGATFSKDGKTIYFASSEFDGLVTQLYKMNVDGTGKEKLTTYLIDKYNPCVK